MNLFFLKVFSCLCICHRAYLCHCHCHRTIWGALGQCLLWAWTADICRSVSTHSMHSTVSEVRVLECVCTDKTFSNIHTLHHRQYVSQGPECKACHDVTPSDIKWQNRCTFLFKFQWLGQKCVKLEEEKKSLLMYFVPLLHKYFNTGAATYFAFSHHYQVSIDFNTGNTNYPAGMYFLIPP